MSYAKRNALLKQLGFGTYRAYLDSGLWRTIRRRALDRDFHRCRVCGGEATQVHHLHYSKMALLGSDLCALVSICGSCHEDVEFKDDKKLSVRSMRSRWRRTRKAIKVSQAHQVFDSISLYDQQSDHIRSIMASSRAPAPEVRPSDSEASASPPTSCDRETKRS